MSDRLSTIGRLLILTQVVDSLVRFIFSLSISAQPSGHFVLLPPSASCYRPGKTRIHINPRAYDPSGHFRATTIRYYA